MAWTTPHVFAVGEGMTASALNAMQDNMTWARNLQEYTVGSMSTSSTYAVNGAFVDIGTAITFTFDGTRHRFEFYAPYYDTGSGAEIWLREGSTSVCKLAYTIVDNRPVYVSFFMSPSAGSHTYKISAFQTFGINTVVGGVDGLSGHISPAWFRIKKAPLGTGVVQR